MTGTVARLAADYIEMRRSLGYRSPSQERAIRAFARHLDAKAHDGPIPLEASLDWATATSSKDPHNPARRLTTVRGFLRHLAARDSATDVPPPGLLGQPGRRKPPHVYADDEIADLIRAAEGLDPVGGLRPHSYATLFGLLACTGLRISEAVSLTCGDVDLDERVLIVRAGKRGRTRVVPLHPSAVPPMRAYDNARRRGFGAPADDEVFLRTDRSDRISYGAASHTFGVLRKKLGWTADGRTRMPRIHDLRHRMAVRRIQAWHADGVNVDTKISVLATYLGHTEVRDLYWYLSAVPELMNIIADRFETFTDQNLAGLS